MDNKIMLGIVKKYIEDEHLKGIGKISSFGEYVYVMDLDDELAYRFKFNDGYTYIFEDIKELQANEPSDEDKYKLEYEIAIKDIKDKSTMHFITAEYNNWSNFLTDGYEGDNIKVYEEVIADLGEDAIEKMWLETHSK